MNCINPSLETQKNLKAIYLLWITFGLLVLLIYSFLSKYNKITRFYHVPMMFEINVHRVFPLKDKKDEMITKATQKMLDVSKS